MTPRYMPPAEFHAEFPPNVAIMPPIVTVAAPSRCRRLCLSTCHKLNWRKYNLRRGDMKIFAAILLGGVLMAAPALAQDNGAGKDDMAKKPEAHHMVNHRERYKRDYKTDREEHQATEDLNKQYRGV